MSTDATTTSAVVLIDDSTAATVEIVTAGPQGPTSPVGAFGEIPDVNTDGAVDKSVLYYDADSAEWRGDDINTLLTLTDGGAF